MPSPKAANFCHPALHVSKSAFRCIWYYSVFLNFYDTAFRKSVFLHNISAILFLLLKNSIFKCNRVFRKSVPFHSNSVRNGQTNSRTRIRFHCSFFTLLVSESRTRCMILETELRKCRSMFAKYVLKLIKHLSHLHFILTCML